MFQVHNILMNSGLQGKIASVAITYSGQYASPPTGITFSGGGGSGAAATISTSGSVQTGSVISITTPSNYYSLGSPAPTVSFSGGGGSGAAASTTVTGVVTAVTVTDRGNYAGSSPPTITTSGGGGSGATFSVGMVWRTVNITGLVANYNYSDKIFNQESVGGPSPLIPTASVTCAYGTVSNAQLNVEYTQSSAIAYYLNGTTPVYNNTCRVTRVSIGATGGQYYTSDAGQWGGFSITISCGNSHVAGPWVTSCDVITWKVGNLMSAPVAVLNQGSGYTSVPTLTFSGGIAYSQATATATVQNKLVAVNLISGGSGYSSSPTVTLSTTGLQSGTGNPVAYTNAGTVYYVTAVTMTNQGSNYTSAPSVSFTGGSPYSAATAVANLI